MPTIRLIKVANLLSLPTAKIVDYLATQGHEVRHNPVTKITEEQYALLKVGFPDEFARARGVTFIKGIRPAPKNPAPPPPPPAQSRPSLRGLKDMGPININKSRNRKTNRSSQADRYATDNTTSDFDLEDENVKYLGLLHKECFDKGFGFIRKIGGKTDVWFHLSRFDGEVVPAGELLVFSVGKSKKHAGKLEALSLQSFSKSILTPEQLLAWYNYYQDPQIRQKLFSKMPLEAKASVLKKEVDDIIEKPVQQIKTSLLQLIKKFFPPAKLSSVEEQLLSSTDEYISQTNAPNLRFSWWLTGLGNSTIPWELILSNLVQGEPTLQVQIFNRTPVDKHPLLFEHLLSSADIDAFLALRKESIPPPLKSSLDHFIKANLTFAEEANHFFAGQWDQVDLNYLLLNHQQLDSIRLFSVVNRANADALALKTFFVDLIKIHLKRKPEHTQDIIHQLTSIDAATKIGDEELAKLPSNTLAIEAPAHLRRQLWEAELITITTSAEKEKWLTDDAFELATLDTWKDATLIDHQEFQNLIQFALKAYPIINSRPQFYGFHELLTRVKHQTTSFQPENQVFFELSSWLTDPDTHPLKEELNQKLVFLNPGHQILMLKKRFHLHETGVTHLSIDDLQKLRHIDLSLYQTAAEVAPELNLDLSVATVIHTLQSLAKDARLLVAGDLIGIMLENITSNRTQKFKITELFESCAGRMEMVYNWETYNRKLFKVHFGHSYYWALQVPYGDVVIDDVKNLPGRKWNPDKKHWGVLKKHEALVLSLARANRFFIDIEGSNYTNNTHLANAKRTEQPRGITYCEGRKANVLDRTHQKDFWWCANAPCFQNCETAHHPEDWRKYTLLDFCRILNLKIDDQDVAGRVVSKSQYYKFVATINRFNRLIEHLYCRDCNEILSPTTETHFGARRISRFQCTKSTCAAHRKEIYLHHCLNGKCNSIIDSRDSKKCSHGLYICANEECGTCCSHKMFSDRLSNLQSVGGYIPQGLVQNVEAKEGHQERGEHFCYSCGILMDKYANDRYHCNHCSITYNLTENRFKRPNANLSSQVQMSGSPPESDNLARPPDLS
ncbi:S1 domain-containing protein [Neolewinella persica]|uniref:cold shock domain-containing protein n=1 Tax=Neolewinella persica TaxID=70998 RepID=UPI00039EDEEB|nr:cold shock domain-containing protein [Neolewinella persica]